MKIIYFFKKVLQTFYFNLSFFSIGISFYPSFEFYSFKGQLLIFAVSTFNGFLGYYIKKL